jgi:hypothetical protein
MQHSCRTLAAATRPTGRHLRLNTSCTLCRNPMLCCSCNSKGWKLPHVWMRTVVLCHWHAAPVEAQGHGVAPAKRHAAAGQQLTRLPLLPACSSVMQRPRRGQQRIKKIHLVHQIVSLDGIAVGGSAATTCNSLQDARWQHAGSCCTARQCDARTHQIDHGVGQVCSRCWLLMIVSCCAGS